VWLWWAGTDGWLAAFGSNTYVWISLGLLAAVPAIRTATYVPAAGR
jgi:alpha-1,2-mannosyltransferase